MLHIQTEKYIKALPADVWKTLIDFESYCDWNPFISAAKKINADRLHIELASGKSKTSFQPIILKCCQDKELRWLGKLNNSSWLFVGEHYFILEEDKGHTRLIHGEHFSGLLAWLLSPFIKGQIKQNFERMNTALEERISHHKL